VLNNVCAQEPARGVRLPWHTAPMPPDPGGAADHFGLLADGGGGRGQHSPDRL